MIKCTQLRSSPLSGFLAVAIPPTGNPDHCVDLPCPCISVSRFIAGLLIGTSVLGARYRGAIRKIRIVQTPCERDQVRAREISRTRTRHAGIRDFISNVNTHTRARARMCRVAGAYTPVCIRDVFTSERDVHGLLGTEDACHYAVRSLSGESVDQLTGYETPWRAHLSPRRRNGSRIDDATSPTPANIRKKDTRATWLATTRPRNSFDLPPCSSIKRYGGFAGGFSQRLEQRTD